jgi:hypothetical protein
MVIVKMVAGGQHQRGYFQLGLVLPRPPKLDARVFQHFVHKQGVTGQAKAKRANALL